jgi:hypothetical protein
MVPFRFRLVAHIILAYRAVYTDSNLLLRARSYSFRFALEMRLTIVGDEVTSL